MDYDYSKAYATYQALVNERSEWETEWRSISDYLLPGRGIYTGTSKPRKRKLTSPRVINTIAEDALFVLTSGMHGGLTSPSRPWFKLEWDNPQLQDQDQFVAWMQEAELRLHAGLHASNFYSVINSFYVEYGGFGTASAYVGHDTYDDDVPFRFELLTAGEYVFSVGPDGRPDQFFRVIFLTERQFVERFPDGASKEAKGRVKKNQSTVDATWYTILECIKKEPYGDEMPWTRVFWEVQTSGNSAGMGAAQEPVEKSGFYEFPYPLARWNTIGSDIWGVGPGSRSLPDVKRLQEMEKSFLMATHKTINPPLNAPARMRGKLNTLPGGHNYYANPQETVNEVYQVRFDFQGVSAAVERVEQRIQRNFFNDIFLTAARDPNATPYKATEVNAREQEKMLRLGPVIERLQHEFLQPVIERCFNIMLRKGLLPEMSPEMAMMAGDYNIKLISPLATAQRSVALQGINSFLAFVGQAAQFDQQVLDKIDTDAAIDEYADITGTPQSIIRDDDAVQQRRQQRQQAQQEQQQKEEQAAAATIGGQVNVDQATARKTEAEAGLAQLEAQQVAEEIGMM